MYTSLTKILPQELIALIGTSACPPVVDVRRAENFGSAERMVPAALWRDHRRASEWLPEIAHLDGIVLYCAHGHNVSELAASAIRNQGVTARVLSGGFEAYLAAGGPTIRRTEWRDPAAPGPSRWVTRERPKVDRIACPWLIRRFVDPSAEIHYVAAEWVRDVADEIGGISFDVPDVAFSHVGEQCSFDAFLDVFELEIPALRDLALIVRAADTDRHALSPQAPGLLALSLGLSLAYGDDHEQLAAGMILYDALYAWCRAGQGETHDWQPAKMRGGVQA